MPLVCLGGGVSANLGALSAPRGASVPLSPIGGEGANGLSDEGQLRSARDIHLTEDAELMLLEDLLAHLVIFHAQGQERFALRIRDEGVEVVDVQLRLEHRRHQTSELG